MGAVGAVDCESDRVFDRLWGAIWRSVYVATVGAEVAAVGIFE